MLEEASAETSERIIAVLGPRLEAISRLVVGLHLEPAIRGDRRARSKLDAAKCLDEVIAAAVPDTQVGPDNSLDVAILRAQVYAAKTAQAAAEREHAKEVFRRENAAAVTFSSMKELAETRRQLKISKEIAARYRHDAETMSAVVEQHKELYQRMENRVKVADVTGVTRTVAMRKRNALTWADAGRRCNSVCKRPGLHGRYWYPVPIDLHTPRLGVN
ncbi:unnamed protein product [Phytophthora fragariaefolia]|uniref:Unnamed protein product n=1 Tax=Phytophthora fragariaefolia TaxID=1490495 RepID=A0A9W6X205_9STRA|nr:unnamed protein product [Phytophthora fragariaefolia]